MNKYSLLTAVLLTSSVFCSEAVQAMDMHLLHDEPELQFLNKVGRLKYIEEKAKIAANNSRLSDKGDLRNNIDGVLRRRFYTIGDGDCFFWGTDLTRARAQELWLQHSGNPNIRAIAADEISEEIIAGALPDALFHNPDLRPRLPEALFQLPCLKTHFEELVTVNELFRVLDRNEGELRGELDFQKSRCEQKIKAACRNEEVYRFYVQNALGQRNNFMLSPQDFGGGIRKTYFIDALAEICQRKLVIWNYNEERTSLIQSHEFIPTIETGTWELLLEGDHYTRVVPTNRQDIIRFAAGKEDEYLNRLMPQFNKGIKNKIASFIDLLLMDTYQRKASSPLMTAVDQSKFGQKAREFAARLDGFKPLSPSTKAAYYKVMLNRVLGQVAQKMTGSLRNAEQADVLEQEANVLKEEALFYREALQQLNIQPSNLDEADVLMQLYYYYGELAEAEELKSLNGAVPEAERVAARKASQDFNEHKAFFRDAFEALEKSLNTVEKIVYEKSKSAQARRKANLDKKLMLNNRWSFESDYNAAKAVSDAHFNALRVRKEKYFNPDYLSADPFAGCSLPELAKDDISDADWTGKILPQFKLDILTCLVPTDNQEYVSNNFFSRGGSINGFNITIDNASIPCVSEEEFQRRTNGSFSSRDVLLEAFGKLGGVFNRLQIYQSGDSMPGQKMNARKRFVRLYELKRDQARLENGEKKNPLVDAIAGANAVLTLAAIEGCPDGVMGSLDIIEANLQGGTKSLEADVSSILSGCAFNFAQKYRGFDPNNPEWTLNAPQFAIQRTKFSLPHSGEARTEFYMLGQPGAYADGMFSPTHLMSTFLKGGRVTNQNTKIYNLRNGDLTLSAIDLNGQRTISVYDAASFQNRTLYLNTGVLQIPGQKSIPLESLLANLPNGHKPGRNQENIRFPLGTYIQTYCVDFDPFTADSFIDLVHAAYKRGVKAEKGGKIIKLANIEAFINSDPWLAKLHEDFAYGDTCEFFAESGGEGYVKRPFFEYMLTKLGYIIDPSNKWESQRKEFEKESKDIDPKFVELGIIDIDGNSLLIPTLKIGESTFKKKDTLKGWAEYINIDFSDRTAALCGWSTIPGEGATPRVALLYKGLSVGVVSVDQDSQDLAAYFGSKGETGDFSKARFRGTVSLANVDLRGFKPEDIKVVGLDNAAGFKELSLHSIAQKGLISVDNHLICDGKQLVQQKSVGGWADTIILDAKAKTLSLSGWSISQGTGAASKIAVLYDGVCYGTIAVNQDSPDVATHLKSQSIKGDYSKCRYKAILDLSSLDLKDFNPEKLQVIGLDIHNGYHSLSKAKVVIQ